MAKLLTGTRIYGTANIDNQLIVGNITPVTSTSNATGSIVVTGGVGISGNLYSGNYVITGTGNGITFVDGTIQTTAFTGSSIDNIARANANAAFATANTAQSNTIIIQGVDLTQNTSINTLNSQVAIIQGVDLGQNTTISAVNNFATGAYNTANTGYNFVTGGGTISGSTTVNGNLTVTGNVSYLGNVTSVQVTGNTGQFFGYAANGFNALYAGIPTGYTVEPETTFQISSNFNGFAQLNQQNINGANQATTDYVVTSGAGNNTTYYVDMGIAGGTYDGTNPNNSLGTSLYPNDGYLYAQGNVPGGPGGNLVIGTSTSGSNVKIIAGGVNAVNVVTVFTGNGVNINVPLNITSLNTSGNLAFTGTGNRITGDFSNTTIASRVAFQTSTLNAGTTIMAIPNGTGAVSQLNLETDSALANGVSFQILANTGGTENRIQSGIRGTGTYLPLTMYTGGSERLRIDTSGNVGIGTTTPSSLTSGLAIVSGTTVGTNNNLSIGPAGGSLGQDSRITFGSTFSNNWAGTDYGTRYSGAIEYGANGGDTTPRSWSMRFLTGTSTTDTPTERMRIDSSGRVMVATTSATEYFQVGNGSADTRISVRPTSAFAIGVANGTNFGGWFGAAGTDTLVFSNSVGTERMRIDSAGNVGVGTSSPSTYGNLVCYGGTLAVASTAGNSFGLSIFSNGQTTSQLKIGQGFGSNTDNIGYFYNTANAAVVLGTNSSEVMRLFASKGVSIGNTTDAGATNLLVAGTITGSSLYGNNSYLPTTWATTSAFIAKGQYGGAISLVNTGGSSDGFSLTLTGTTSQLNFYYGTNGGTAVATGAAINNTGTIFATSFSGAGTGLTGTAASLSIGGSAATITGTYGGTLTSSQVTTALGFTPGTGTVTAVTGTAPIVSSGGTTPAISLAASGVTAGSYTNSNLTVDTYGRITTITNGTAGGSTSGYLPNAIIVANTSGYLSNTSNLQYYSSNNTLALDGNFSISNTSTSNSATMIYNATLNSIDFYFN